MSFRRRILIAAGAGALALALTSCSAQIVDGQEDAAATVSEAPESAAAPTPAPDASSPAAEADSDTSSAAPEEASGTYSAETEAAREDALAAVTTTLTCTDTLTIDQTAAIVRIDGPCPQVTVTMDAGVVIADDVEDLRVLGASNVIYARSLTSVFVTGDANAVRWAGETPEVQDSGAGNIIVAG